MSETGEDIESNESITESVLSRRAVLAAIGSMGAAGWAAVLTEPEPDPSRLNTGSAHPGTNTEPPSAGRQSAGIKRKLQARSWPRPRDIGTDFGALTGTNGSAVLSELPKSSGGRRYSANRRGSIQAAIDQASQGDTVVVDRTFEISETIQCKSGVTVVGSSDVSGPHIRIADGVGIDGISPARTRNVRLHNLMIDGNRASGGTQGFDAAIGSQNIGFVENLTLSNCTVKYGTQGIVIRSGEPPHRLRNVSVINCYVDGSHKHGVYIGEYDHSASGRFDNLTIEGNIVTNTERFIGITFQGRENAPVANSAIRYNYVDNVGNQPNAEGGEGVYTEDHVYKTTIEWNLVADCGSQAGGVTMAGDNWGNVARNNLVRNCYGGLCFSGLWHNGDGPTNCTMEHNTVESVDDWGIRAEEIGTGNAVRRCVFEDYSTRVLGGDVSLSGNVWNQG